MSGRETRAAVAHPNQSVAQGDIAPELCKGVRALLPPYFCNTSSSPKNRSLCVSQQRGGAASGGGA